MLNEEDLKKHKQLIEKVNELSKEKNDIISMGKVKKQQGLDILKNYGLSDLKDISKLQEKLEEIEIKLKEEQEDILKEINEINSLKEAVDNLLLS